MIMYQNPTHPISGHATIGKNPREEKDTTPFQKKKKYKFVPFCPFSHFLESWVLHLPLPPPPTKSRCAGYQAIHVCERMH